MAACQPRFVTGVAKKLDEQLSAARKADALSDVVAEIAVRIRRFRRVPRHVSVGWRFQDLGSLEEDQTDPWCPVALSNRQENSSISSAVSAPVP